MKNILKIASVFALLLTAGFAYAEGDVRTLSAQDVQDDSAELVGEVTDGDNLEVWFALDDRDSTPSCSSNSQREDVSGRFDDGDEFELDVRNLDEDERYYFRACAEDEDGDIVSGAVRDFTTDDDDRNRNDDVDVTTDSVVDVDDDSAELRGEVEEGDDVEVWFALREGSSSPSCSSNSQREDVSGRFDEGDTFRERVTNLDEDTRYTYRACAEDDDGDIVSGSSRTFTTDDDDDNNRSFDDDDDLDFVEDEIRDLRDRMDVIISLLSQLIQLQQFRF